MKTPQFFQRSELGQTLWVFRREFIIVGVLSAIVNVLMLAPTLYMMQVYDRVLVSYSEVTLMAVSLITLFLFGVLAFSERIRSQVLVGAGMRLDERLGTRVFNASFESYLGQATASPSRAFNDLIEIRQFLTGIGIFALFDAPWAPVYIAVTFVMHPLLGITCLVFAVFQGLLAWYGHRNSQEPTEAAVKANQQSQAYLQSKLRNAEVLESMGMIPNLAARWRKLHAGALETTAHSQDRAHRINAISKFLRYSQQSLALGAGALLVIDGQLSPGGMIAANVLMTRALAPIDMLVSTWRGFVSARGAYLRLESLLNEYPEQDPGLKRVAPSGAVALRDVFATAPHRAEPILKNVSLDLPAGTVVGIVGPSGSGKSTLARTMVGIWPNVSGEVLLDGLPVAGWDRVQLGPHIGYLPQDVELFDGTIAENIARFGQLDSDKVIEAARAAGLHEMILRFPKGYDMPIGEAGGLLSGGQRQRIGLARAIYGTPALVVLDEPNANLDEAGEAALARAVQELKAKGRTVVLVTHRPSALAACDRIVMLRNGEVAMQGPREEVLAALRPPAPAAPAAGALPNAA
ncbi:type I secretion system permease/ATPase [Ramlibacter albus]|uniref:Type I secretion system permease/ATPase n=1 Tax=Ramlibacter albus TaxID=2079448 RepID=A0A923S1S6_9BURK|nr:type I secretion system permease/ATPase [Ramlibacter albus]MBC5764734.1 type I secretion system permease/ATPase [Ramlibacter albus]